MGGTVADDEPLSGPGGDFHGMPRISKVWLVAGGGWIGRGVQVVAQLVAVRILTDSLGTDGYGVFAVLGSLAGWFALGDFSIAISLQNHISGRRATGRDADDAIYTATLLSGIAAAILAVVMLVTGPWLSKGLLGEFDFLTPQARTLVFYAMAFPGIGTALGGVVYKIWFAQHRGYLSNLLPAGGAILGTLAIWLVARTGLQPALGWSILLYYAPLALLPLAALTWVAFRNRRHRFRTDLVRPLLRHAARFWVFGLLAAAVLQVDYIIMAQVLPPRDIVVYNVASKLFFLVFFVYNALILALWPVCSEAIVRNEWLQVFAMVRRYLLIGTGFTFACGIGVALFNPLVVRVIAPSLDSQLPILVVVLLTIYIVVRVWTDTFAMILQSMNDLKIFWIVVPLQSILSIGFQILGARWFGLPGMIVGLTLCFMLTVAWVLPLRCISHARRGAAGT
jgi:O-antigen/teichoic acid export membrane protein